LINSHIHGVDASVNDMWNSIGNLQNVVNEINSPISDVKETMENLKTVVDGIDLANDDLWKEMRRLDGMTKDVRNRQDELGSRVEKYQKDNRATQDILSYSVTEINKAIANIGERIKILEAKMDSCVDVDLVDTIIGENCYTKSESDKRFKVCNLQWN
jgi:ABC-type transporter Mla subunit MlaD